MKRFSINHSELIPFLNEELKKSDRHFRAETLHTAVDISNWKTKFWDHVWEKNRFLYNYMNRGYIMNKEDCDEYLDEKKVIPLLDRCFKRFIQNSMSEFLFCDYMSFVDETSSAYGPYMKAYPEFLKLENSLSLKKLVTQLTLYTHLENKFKNFKTLHPFMTRMVETNPIVGPSAILVTHELTPSERVSVLEEYRNSRTVSVEEIRDFLKHNYRID